MTPNNAFDCYSSQSYKHNKSDVGIHAPVKLLQPVGSKVLSIEGYF